ncbi:hypothetical protein D3C71_78620 [compost metagenome]
MTAFQTAYDTTICKEFVTRKTAEAIQVAIVNGSLHGDESNPRIAYVEGGSVTDDAIPSFAHPMIVHNTEKQELLVVDLRSVGRYDPQQHKFSIRNDVEHSLLKARAQLNDIWLGQYRRSLKSLSPLPMAVFSSWLSEAIGRRFALDAREQLNLAILAAIFYNSLFDNETELSDEEKNRLAGVVARATRASADDVYKLLDAAPVIADVKAFVGAAQELGSEVRLKNLSAGLLYEIVGGTWYGLNAREVIAVALEHPPTWIAVLLAAYNERSFKNSQITKITERPSNRDNGGNFLRSVLTLIQQSAV